jgi:DNA-binding XRE family transcriptional regulator
MPSGHERVRDAQPLVVVGVFLGKRAQPSGGLLPCETHDSAAPADKAGAVESHELFANNLRRQRQRAGLSQEALGHACDLHRTEVSLLERAAREPRLSTIVRLARALDIPPGKLLDGIR